MKLVETGIPQGTVLDPLLFLVSVNKNNKTIYLTLKLICYVDNPVTVVTDKN